MNEEDNDYLEDRELKQNIYQTPHSPLSPLQKLNNNHTNNKNNINHSYMNNNDTKLINYGILGCAAIANKIARAIVLEENSTLLAVGSRNEDKAKKFIKRNGLQNVKICSYKELINNHDIHVVYIPLPTSLKLPWIIKAIEKGKNVLVEKPIGSPKSMDLIIPSCKAKNVQFMDGIQFMHHPRFKHLTEKLHKSKIIGKVQRIISSFSVPCLDDENIRNKPKLEPLGVLGDLGVHNIRLSLWAFDYEQPIYVKAICHKRNKKGAMQDISVWLFFSDDRVASFDCSYYCPLRQHAEIVGETGTVELRQFVLPNETNCNYSIHYTTLNRHDTSELIKYEHFYDNIQEKYMIKRMTKLTLNKQHEQIWPQLTLMTEKVLDACRRSIDKSGKLVEFVKYQVNIPKTDRRLSIIGSNINFNILYSEFDYYRQQIDRYHDDDDVDGNETKMTSTNSQNTTNNNYITPNGNISYDTMDLIENMTTQGNFL